MKIPYLTSKKLANGEIAYYFNLPARLIPEGCAVKSQSLGKDYFAACQKALELYQQLKNYKRTGENINIKSVSGLWRLYLESRFYQGLAERTKKDYTYAFGLIEKRKTNPARVWQLSHLIYSITTPHTGCTRGWLKAISPVGRKTVSAL